MTTKNEPEASIFDGNVQLEILSHIPDNFQCVAEMVFDLLPKASRVDCVKELSKEYSIKFFGCKQRQTST